MQGSVGRKRDTSSRVSSGAERKQVRKVHTRKIPYRVGYSWNKGGRLKELRIRHLARKFLRIWMQNTFGRILPHKAKSHCDSVVLRRAFGGWRDEWWTSRREWSLSVRAECHYRYRQQMSLVWERWKVFIETRRQKRKMLESAVERNRLASLHSAWSLWQALLRRYQDLHTLEDQALKQRALTLQSRRAFDLRLMRTCWSEWSSALDRKRNEEERLQTAEHLAIRSTQRRTLERWRACILMCRCVEKRLKDTGLQVNIIIISYCTSLLSSCLQHWREKLAKQQRMQVLEHRADIRFAERMLPLCFNSWVEFTLQRRLHKQRKHKAEVYNRQRQYSLVFYTWWGESEKHKEQMLSERLAILHEERCLLQRAWSRWKLRTEQQMDKEQKWKASERLYRHRLLDKTMKQLKDNSTEMQDRRNREQQAYHRGDMRCLRWAVENWKKYVQSQREKKSRLKQMQQIYEVKLLNRTFVAWKKHHLQMCQTYRHAEGLHRQQKRNFLRTALCVWRENAVLLTEVRLQEQRAQNHFQRFLLFKVFLAWREAAACSVSKRHQQGEAVNKAQRSINQVRLLRSFRHWRTQTREARRERVCMVRARRYHESKLLSKALKAWNEHHNQHHKNKVMRRQGIFLLRLKMYQTYFEQWRIKLQHRRREAKQMERALWHWSLSLQAKVLYGWRQTVTEQRRKQEQAVRAAEVYRDQLLREGVTCILTYAAHMNNLTTSLTQHSQEQRSRHLQRVVRRCAMRWKQRALCTPRREQEVKEQPPKKSVSFCLTTSGRKRVSPSDSEGQEAEDGGRSELRGHRRQPRRCKELFESTITLNTQKQTAVTKAPNPSLLSLPAPEGHQTALSCLHPPKAPFPSTHQSTIISNVSPCEHQTQNKDVLLPPSAFMTAGTKDMLGKSNCSGFGDASLHQFVPPFEHSSAHSDVCQRASGGGSLEDAATDSASALTEELLGIQLDMMTYQRDRKQLRAWQKLKEVLQSWVQTSGAGEQMERNAVCEELKELEERIDRLSAELAKRKPSMRLHAERIRHLQTALQDSGVSFLRQRADEMETDPSVLKKYSLTLKTD
ncbi:hypothetical protein NQZ68_028000 [Dissostichus eleginoides]|nr:hypothetical protein NQZ68_028000 [Dissostichus eleginoides]